MADNFKNIVCLSELSKEMEINKSKLQYYYYIGLIKETTRLGGVLMFDRKEVSSRFKKIDALRRGGHSLKEIKSILYGDKTTSSA